MSFFSGGKSKEKDLLSKKSQFYVEFLGWMECRGLRGKKYTEPVVKELRRRQKKIEAPPKLTLEVSVSGFLFFERYHRNVESAVVKLFKLMDPIKSEIAYISSAS